MGFERSPRRVGRPLGECHLVWALIEEIESAQTMHEVVVQAITVACDRKHRYRNARVGDAPSFRTPLDSTDVRAIRVPIS